MKKKLEIENSKIEVTFESDKEKIKKNLINVYDVINKIADSFEKRGLNTSDWFLNEEELEKMKISKNYNFL